MSERILWLDLETTGLRFGEDVVLEVGMAVSEGLGDVIDTLSCPVLPALTGLAMPPVVRVMHEESGLLDDIEAFGVTVLDARYRVQRFLDKHFGTSVGDITAGGSGIDRFDVPFLRAWQVWRPITNRFHFRTIDTSAMRELMRRAGVPTPDNSDVAHRALPDALWSHSVAQHATDLFIKGASA